MTSIYYGEAGTGKTTAMMEEIRRAAQNGESCLLFVPEQFSFDAERAVYFAVGAENSRFVTVTGFSKLARKILTLYKKAKPCADDAVKLITMWKTVENAKGDFLSFDREKNSAGFCRLMLKTVAAFRNGGVSPGRLREMLEKQTEMQEELADKAGDFLRIYEDYDRELTKSLDDKLDDVSRAALLAQEHEYFKGMRLFFDNFDSFSAAQRSLLSAAIPQVESTLLCFTTDSPVSSKRQFLCVSKTIGQVTAIAADTVFKEFGTPYRAEKRDEDPVEIFSAKTPYDEAELAAAKIHHLVREKGLRYRDFLVLTAQREYESVLISRFAEGEIPVFCDLPHPMTDKPVVGFVLQLLKALELDTDEVLRLTESGFKRIYEGGRARLLLNSEAYSLRQQAAGYDITAADWEKDWSVDPRKELNSLEALRAGVIEPLITLRGRLAQAKDGAELSSVFMSYLLEQEDIQATFKARSKAGGGGETDTLETDPQLAEEYSRIWDALSEAVSSMAYCLKGVRITVPQYRSLLEEILSGINLANPPAVLDSVTIGDIERTRKASPKVVIIVGANEGRLPAKTKLQSAFTYFERESLNGQGLSLYDTNLNRWSKERYFAYRAMSLYEKRLIITYCRQDLTGNGLEPAQELLKDCNADIKETESLPAEYFLNTRGDVRALLAKVYGNDRELAEGLKALLEEDAYCEALDNALKLVSGRREFKLSPQAAKKVFGNPEYSPTRLESAFSCPFMYFCRYGLKLYEQQERDPASAANIGTAVHDIMRTALEECGDIRTKNDAELAQIARAAVKKAEEKAVEADPTCPQRTEAIYLSLVNRISSMLEQTRLDCISSGFVPDKFEERVSYRIEDPQLPVTNEGRCIKIGGIADRIDRLTVGEKQFIRVSDYKTGKRSFTAEGIENGEDLQMLLYLFSQCGDAMPAGVGYVRAGAAAPVRADSTDAVLQSDIEKGWYSDHGISGAMFDSPEVKAAYERAEQAIKEKTNSPRKSFNSLIKLPAKDFGEFRKKVEEQVILPKIKELLNGGIAADPSERDGKKACDYCPFWGSCGA